MLSSDLIKDWTIKKISALITNRPSAAKRALTKVACELRPCKPASLNRQGMGPHPEVQQHRSLGLAQVFVKVYRP